MKTYKTRIVSIALTMMLSLSMVASAALVTPVNAASAPKAPVQVTGVNATVNSTSQITIKWNQIKQNKNTNGYEIYRNGKYLYRTSVKAKSYVDKKLKAGTKYTYKVRAFKSYKQKQYYNSKTKKWQNKKPAKKDWKKCPSGTYKGKNTRTVTLRKYGKFSKTISAITKKKVVNNSTNTGNKSTHTHTYTRPANKNPLEELLKGKCHEVCSCGDERILYAKWVKVEDARPEIVDYPKRIYTGAVEIRCYGPDCTESSPRHRKCYEDGDWYLEGCSNIYLCWNNEELLEKAGFSSREEAREFVKKHNEIFGTNYYTDIDLAEEFLYTHPWVNYTIDYVLDNKIHINNNGDHATAGMVADGYGRNNTGQYSMVPERTHIPWTWAEFLSDWRYPEIIPAQKERGYWDYRKGSYNPSSVGWSSTLLNNKELAYGYGVGSYQF